MGYFVTKLTAVAGGKGGKGKKKKTGKSRKTFTIGGVSQKMLCTFTRQFSTLQDAGLPVLRSLHILERQMKPGVLKNALIDVVDDVESGSTLSEAFGKHPKCFDRLYVNMVKAGEAGGALEVILQRLAEFKEKAQSLKRKIIGAMVYPAVVIFVAVAHPDLHHDLHHPEVQEDLRRLRPEAAVGRPRSLIDVSTWFASTGDASRCSRWASTCSFKLIRLNQSRELRPRPSDALDTRSSASSSRRRSSPGRCGRWARWSAPACRSWRRSSIVQETANNAVFERMFQRVYESIREGDTIAEPLKESRLVDDMVVNMIDVGEETGDLDTMLYKIADFYDEEVDALVEVADHRCWSRS